MSASPPAPGTIASPWTEGDYAAYLSPFLDTELVVRMTRASSRVIELRPARAGEPTTLRLNGLFAEAPSEVREALAKWLKNGRRSPRACQLLDDWIEVNHARLHGAGRPPREVRTRGAHHDLGELAAELMEIELRDAFGDREPPLITWGTSRLSRARRSLRLGSYDLRANVARVHTVLDQEAVPRFFVRYVLFHELLHAALPASKERGGRWEHHGTEFRVRERGYEDHARSAEWETRNLKALIRSARTGEPMAGKGARPGKGGVVGWVQGVLFG